MAAICFAAAAVAVYGQDEAGTSAPPKISNAVQAREKAAARQRRLLFNNDGNDAVHFPASLAPTDENFWQQRTMPLLKTQVDAVFYCTNRGIGLVLHRSSVNEVLTKEARAQSGPYAGKRNIVADLLQRGTDPLALMAKFCRTHGKEIFWSMRMNDTHDAGNNAMLSEFKKSNPEFLLGSPKNPPPYRGYTDLWGGRKGMSWGGYSGVDYSQPAVRDLVYRTVAEVSANYDIDGIELDFFRSPVLFKSHAWDRDVSPQEKVSLTDLMRKIRATADQRVRPLLLAIRVPDSVAYCESMGIELDKWLGEGLVDMLLPGGDFLLNPWETSVALARRHGVKVYPVVTRAPTSANPGYEERSAIDCYRGRALRAWTAGADGLYIFNIFDANAPLLRELGDAALLRRLSRSYYGSELPTWHARVYHRAGLSFRTLPLLSPEHPEVLQPRQPFMMPIEIPEDMSASPGSAVAVTLGVKLLEKEARPEQVSVNGILLEQPEVSKGWVEYQVPAPLVKKGNNVITLTAGTRCSLSDVRISVAPMSRRQ